MSNLSDLNNNRTLWSHWCDVF